MNPQNGLEKVDADVEELANSRRLSALGLHEIKPVVDETGTDDETTDDDLIIVRGTEADVNRDDLLILGDKDADLDMGDDEDTGNRSRVDKLPEDEGGLDIPGSDLDDSDEVVGEEDEENNYYSIGGDRHEDLEEDPTAPDDEETS